MALWSGRKKNRATIAFEREVRRPVKNMRSVYALREAPSLQDMASKVWVDAKALARAELGRVAVHGAGAGELYRRFRAFETVLPDAVHFTRSVRKHEAARVLQRCWRQRRRHCAFGNATSSQPEAGKIRTRAGVVLCPISMASMEWPRVMRSCLDGEHDTLYDVDEMSGYWLKTADFRCALTHREFGEHDVARACLKRIWAAPTVNERADARLLARQVMHIWDTRDLVRQQIANQESARLGIERTCEDLLMNACDLCERLDMHPLDIESSLRTSILAEWDFCVDQYNAQFPEDCGLMLRHAMELLRMPKSREYDVHGLREDVVERIVRSKQAQCAAMAQRRANLYVPNLRFPPLFRQEPVVVVNPSQGGFARRRLRRTGPAAEEVPLPRIVVPPPPPLPPPPPPPPLEPPSPPVSPALLLLDFDAIFREAILFDDDAPAPQQLD